MRTLNPSDFYQVQGGRNWQDSLTQVWIKVCDFFARLNQSYDRSGVTGWPTTLPYM